MSAHDPRSVMTLADLDPGDHACISRLYSEKKDALKKLIAMGLLPKTRLRLLRRKPTYVFSVGNARFAVDADLARTIFVEREHAAV